MTDLNRRGEILKVAGELFFSRGYDKTSVADIIKKAKISKGGVYHYFQSKEQLLDELVELHTLKPIEQWQTIRTRKDIGVVEKLKEVFKGSFLIKANDPNFIFLMIKHYWDPSNVLWREKQKQKTKELMNRELASLIYEGISEGVFDTLFPDDVLKVLVDILTKFSDEQGLINLREKERIKEVYAQMDFYLCRILGIKDKHFHFIYQEQLEWFLKKMDRDQ